VAESLTPPAWTAYPDLASRELAGSVVTANDELFAERENLIRPEPPVHELTSFGHKGKVYDGWETRRRRDRGNDWAIVRLGVPGVVRGVIVDTSWFTGNYPPFVSVEGAIVDGYPSATELDEWDWVPLVEKSPAHGDAVNSYDVTDDRTWTHVRLSIYPDGGVARLRVHGEPVPDARFMTGTIDLAAIENGARLVRCSNAFYSSPQNLIMPGRGRRMSDGWENARRRDDDNDYAIFQLAGEGVVRHVELDTSYFVGNAPGWMRLTGCNSTELDPRDELDWWVLVHRMRAQPDTRHRLLVEDTRPVTHVRLDVYPDGGLSRLRVWGELTVAALDTLEARTDLRDV
jgi:allantoicase